MVVAGPRAAQFRIARTGADELILASQIFDHTARLRSFEIASEVRVALSA